jgi:ethanolamine ammonia-lyase small subunit
METFEAIEGYLNRVANGLKQDAEDKQQKIPVSSIRVEVTTESGDLLAADYMKYLIYGRPPGKQPPVDKMIKFVEDTPSYLANLQNVYPSITVESAAYLAGRKIAQVGTDIWEGKKAGIDLLGVMDREKPLFLEQLGEAAAADIGTTLRNALR